MSRNRQAEKSRNGLTSHSGDIAQAACEATMAYRISRMPLLAEVNSLQSKVRGDKRFVSARQSKEGAIVADAAHHVLPGAYSSPDTFNKRFFGQWQNSLNIRRQRVASWPRSRSLMGYHRNASK